MSMCYHCMQDTIENGCCTICGKSGGWDNTAKNLMALPTGTMLDNGNIMVGRVLGSGGFGITYIALDRKYGRIALKEFLPRNMIARERRDNSIVPSAQLKEIFDKSKTSFVHESCMLNALRHPHIVNVLFDKLEENGTVYYGMELLKGRSLREWMRERQKISPQEAYDLLKPIIDALDYVHKRKTLHRDVSPDNIFLRDKPDGSVSPCLIDFGAAFTELEIFTVTQSMLPARKHGFSPPEQELLLKTQGTYTDVYALVATFYFLVTGRVPPTADGEGRPRNNDPLEKPSVYNREVSPELDEVVMRGMALDLHTRIQTMNELSRELERAVKGRPVGPTPLPKPKIFGIRTPAEVQELVQGSVIDSDVNLPRKRSWRTVIAALLDVLVFIVLFVLMMQEDIRLLGIPLGMAVSFAVNTLLTPLLQGTLMQRVFGVRLEGFERTAIGWLRSLVYNFFHVLLPFSLVDELVSCCSGRDLSLSEQLALRLGNQELTESSIAFILTPEAPENDKAVLLCTQGALKNQKFLIDEKATLGRDAAFSTICVPESERRTSKKHCMIYWRDGVWYIEDCHSSNGTFVEGKRLGETPQRLEFKNKIQIGELSFVFKEAE